MIGEILTALLGLLLTMGVFTGGLYWGSRRRRVLQPAAAAELPDPNPDPPYTLQGARVWLPPGAVSDAVWAQLCPPPEPERVEEPPAAEPAGPQVIEHGAASGFTLHVASREPMCPTCRSALIARARACYPDAGTSDMVTVSMHNQPLIRLRLTGHGGYTVEHMYRTGGFGPLPWAVTGPRTVDQLVQESNRLMEEITSLRGKYPSHSRDEWLRILEGQLRDLHRQLLGGHGCPSGDTTEVMAFGQPEPVRRDTAAPRVRYTYVPRVGFTPVGQPKPAAHYPADVLAQVRAASR